MQLFKEMFKPLVRYLNDADHREYMHVRSKCRRTKKGERLLLTIQGISIETMNAEAFLHLYEEIVVHRSLDADIQNDSPTIICAGANIGLEIFLLSKKYPSAKIIAYEADPEYADLFRKNLIRNHVKNVEFIEAAVWTGNGKIPFVSDGGLGGKVSSGGREVKAVDFGDELKKYAPVDLLLMDIEGAESAVIDHVSEQLPLVKNIFVEWHGKENKEQDLPHFLQLLSDAGFRYRLDNKLPVSPFKNRLAENGFDAMTGIYAHRP